jgi:hypothetical protein
MFAAARVMAENNPRQMARRVALTPESPLHGSTAAESAPAENRRPGKRRGRHLSRCHD